MCQVNHSLILYLWTTTLKFYELWFTWQATLKELVSTKQLFTQLYIRANLTSQKTSQFITLWDRILIVAAIVVQLKG